MSITCIIVSNNKKRKKDKLLKEKWYLKTWLICILFALWFIYGIPLIVGIILLLLKRKEENLMISQLDNLTADNQRYAAMMTPEMQNAIELEERTEKLRQEEASIHSLISELNAKIFDLEKTINDKQKQIISMDDEILVQEFGLYKPQFEFATALDYKEELAKIRALQKDLIRDKDAVTGSTDWTVNGNKAKGRKMISDTQKLLLRAFNTECDGIVSKVKYTNFDASLNRIRKSSETISKLGTVMNISITKKYLDAKIKELRLAFEYQHKKQEEN